MLTIAKIDDHSIAYYESTVSQEAGRTDGGYRQSGVAFDSTEYYREGGDAVPTAFVVPGRGEDQLDANLTALLSSGVQDGQALEADEARRWLSDQTSIDGSTKLGRRTRVKGFDVTLAMPKEASILWALGDDHVRAEIEASWNAAVRDSFSYLSEHAGYTRVHDADATAAARAERAALPPTDPQWIDLENPADNGKGQVKKLVKLDGLQGVRYDHWTSRLGDPHGHSHMLLSNRQSTRDGVIGSVDGTSLYHEARAAGMVNIARFYAETTRRLGVEWGQVNERSGQRELVGLDRGTVEAWSRRHTEMEDWAQDRGFVDPDRAAVLAQAQKATREKKDHRDIDVSRAEWRADERAEGIDLTPGAGIIGRRQSELVAEIEAIEPDPETVLALVTRTKSAFTRQDVVEALGTLWPTNCDPETVLERIEEAADRTLDHHQAISLSADPRYIDSGARRASEREGAVRFTTTDVLQQEARTLSSALSADDRRAIDIDEQQLDELLADRRVSADQRAVIAQTLRSSNVLTPVVAPAGAGKTSGVMSPLSAAYQAQGRTIVGLSPTGKAADGLRQEGVTAEAQTVAAAWEQIRRGQHGWTPNHVIMLDEAGMVSNADLAMLLDAAHRAGAKVVAVGDPEQLQPVQARGGLFEQLTVDCPDTGQLTEVFRQRDEDESAAALMLRDGNEADVHDAARWYAEAGRAHTGSASAMMDDAYEGWRADREAGLDALLLASTNDQTDNLNKVAQLDDRAMRWAREHVDEYDGDLAAARAAYTAAEHGPDAIAQLGNKGVQHQVAVGEPLITRKNMPDLLAHATDDRGRHLEAGSVRNGQRWIVDQINADGSVVARRTDDGATATLPADYLAEHAHLGYASTIHTAQGVTADTTHAALDLTTADRSLLYVAATRGRDANHAYLYERRAGDAEHEHREVENAEESQEARYHRGDVDAAAAAMEQVAGRDTRDRTAHSVYEENLRIAREQLAERRERDRQLAAEQAERTAMEKAHEERSAATMTAFERVMASQRKLAAETAERDASRGEEQEQDDDLDWSR